MNPNDPTNDQTPQNQGTTPPNDMPLNQPNDVPVQTGNPGAGDDTQPAMDGNVDSDQSYQEGQSAAAGADQPNQGGAVTGFNPDDDQQTPPPTAPGGTPETPPDGGVSQDPAQNPGDGDNAGGAYGSSSFNG